MPKTEKNYSGGQKKGYAAADGYEKKYQGVVIKTFLPEKAVAEWVWNSLLTENNIEAIIEVLALFRGLNRTGII